MSKSRVIEYVGKADGILFFGITLQMASIQAWYTANRIQTSVGKELLLGLAPEKVFKCQHELAIVTPLPEDFDDGGNVDFAKVVDRASSYNLKLPSLEKYPALLSFVSSQECRKRGDYDCVCLVDELFGGDGEVLCATKTFCGRYVLEVHSVKGNLIGFYPSLSFLFERM